jgi:hypothetical protein
MTTAHAHGPAVRDARFVRILEDELRELEALCLARGQGVEPRVPLERILAKRETIGDKVKDYLARVRAGRA